MICMLKVYNGNLIENKILENYKIKVSQDDLLTHAKQLIRIQMKQYMASQRVMINS